MPCSETSFPIVGILIFLFLGAFFHCLEEGENPAAVLPFIWDLFQGVNSQIGARFKTTSWRVVQWELAGIGIALMSIREWLAAIACWVMVAVVGGTVSFTRKDKSNQSLVLPILSSAGWVVLCVLLIAMTTLKKPDSDPWSSLQKLWRNEDSIETVSNPYDLSGKRRKDFKTLLARSSDETDILRIGCLAGSDSACVAAGQFLLLLSEAGWKIDSNKVFRMDAQIQSITTNECSS
jgi:hypothetical protein